MSKGRCETAEWPGGLDGIDCTGFVHHIRTIMTTVSDFWCERVTLCAQVNTCNADFVEHGRSLFDIMGFGGSQCHRHSAQTVHAGRFPIFCFVAFGLLGLLAAYLLEPAS